MAEEQALSRIHRMGQTKPVKTVRYIMKDSIEEVSCPLLVVMRCALLTIEEYSRITATKA
jgi:hypothetical protein